MNSILKTQKTIIFLAITFMVSFGFSQNINAKKNFSATIKINKSADNLWKVITDVSKWKNWDKNIIDANLDNFFEKKAKGNFIPMSGQVKPFKILNVINKKSYTYYYKLSSGRVYIKRTIELKNEEVYFTEKVWVKGLSTRNVIKYLGSDYNTIIIAKIKRFKNYVEGI